MAVKYASALTKNLGLACNSWSCFTGQFLIMHPFFAHKLITAVMKYIHAGKVNLETIMDICLIFMKSKHRTVTNCIYY